jgi:type VI secretion system secreted protein Hcp
MVFDAFLKIDGIEGECADNSHRNEIEVLSFNWGIDQEKTHSSSPSAGDRVNFHPFSIVKKLDKSSPKLAIACISGEVIKNIRLELRRAGGDQQPIMEYRFSDVLITSFRPAGTVNSESILLEEVSFSYAKIELRYMQKGAGNIAAGWDLRANRKI